MGTRSLCLNSINKESCNTFYPIQHLLAQSQELKHRNNYGNMLKVNNEDTRPTLLTLLTLLLTFNIFYTLFSVSILDFEQENPTLDS